MMYEFAFRKIQTNMDQRLINNQNKLRKQYSKEVDIKITLGKFETYAKKKIKKSKCNFRRLSFQVSVCLGYEC